MRIDWHGTKPRPFTSGHRLSNPAGGFRPRRLFPSLTRWRPNVCTRSGSRARTWPSSAATTDARSCRSRTLARRVCVGFDQSSAFLAQAAELKTAGALDCQFVEGDIYQTAPEFDSAFDLVAITIGVLGWMPELGKFFDVAVRLLRPVATLHPRAAPDHQHAGTWR